jgi:malic enzyme
MAKKAVVFACANPVPEIYPHAAHSLADYAVGRGITPENMVPIFSKDHIERVGVVLFEAGS